MLVFALMLLHSQAHAEPLQEESGSSTLHTDTGSGQWEDVMELLNHINDTESKVLPIHPIATQSDIALCYESTAAWTQLYIMTLLTWEPLGVPVEGSVVEALRAQPNPHVRQTAPTFVLPCAIMEMPVPYSFTSVVTPAER